MANPRTMRTEHPHQLLDRLERIETGLADVEEARSLLVDVLDAHNDEDGASEVFSSLRSWTGRMLRGSISGDDLRAWHALFKAAAAHFREDLRDYSVRIDVLADLIYERAGMTVSNAPADILSRLHVRAILRSIADETQKRSARARLGQKLGLEQANLSRVCTMMADAGLIARVQDGRTVGFELTALGAAHARIREAAPVSGSTGAADAADRWEAPDPTQVAIGELGASEASAEDWSVYDDPSTNVWLQPEAA